MKKLLFLVLIALILGSISCGAIEDEWEKAKATCAKIKAFLKKYGIYDDVVKLLTKGQKQQLKQYARKNYQKEFAVI